MTDYYQCEADATSIKEDKPKRMSTMQFSTILLIIGLVLFFFLAVINYDPVLEYLKITKSRLALIIAVIMLTMFFIFITAIVNVNI